MTQSLSMPSDHIIEPDARDVAALTESLYVFDDEDYHGLSEFEVAVLSVRDDGSVAEYVANPLVEWCECDDHHYRDAECKHLRRIAFARGERDIPEWVEWSAVDHVLKDDLEASR